MNRTRQFRRHHQARMRAKGRRIAVREAYDGVNGPSKPEVRSYWEHQANNLTACSCAMCGNPRKYFKEKTLAEQDESWREECS